MQWTDQDNLGLLPETPDPSLARLFTPEGGWQGFLQDDKYIIIITTILNQPYQRNQLNMVMILSWLISKNRLR